jgi:predicted membrane channel-forming protein YqfA (hemolysin III family)
MEFDMNKQLKVKLSLMVLVVVGWCSYLWLNGISVNAERPVMKITAVVLYCASLITVYFVHKAFKYFKQNEQ